jgi:hypothetical protein
MAVRQGLAAGISSESVETADHVQWVLWTAGLLFVAGCVGGIAYRRRLERMHRAAGLLVGLNWVRQHNQDFPIAEWWGGAYRHELWLLRDEIEGPPELFPGVAFRADPREEEAIAAFLCELGRPPRRKIVLHERAMDPTRPWDDDRD